MKVIQYNSIYRVNTGTADIPVWVGIKGEKVTRSLTETNLRIAEYEAWLGNVEVIDDGRPDTSSIHT